LKRRGRFVFHAEHGGSSRRRSARSGFPEHAFFEESLRRVAAGAKSVDAGDQREVEALAFDRAQPGVAPSKT